MCVRDAEPRDPDEAEHRTSRRIGGERVALLHRVEAECRTSHRRERVDETAHTWSPAAGRDGDTGDEYGNERESEEEQQRLEERLRLIDEVFVECSFVELYIGQAYADDVVCFLREAGLRLVGIHGLSVSADNSTLQADLHFRRHPADIDSKSGV